MSDKEEKKVTMYAFAISYLKEKLDVTNYINLVEYVEKIQLLNFNEYQNLIFKNSKLPNLMSKEDCELFELDITSKRERT